MHSLFLIPIRSSQSSAICHQNVAHVNCYITFERREMEFENAEVTSNNYGTRFCNPNSDISSQYVEALYGKRFPHFSHHCKTRVVVSTNINYDMVFQFLYRWRLLKIDYLILINIVHNILLLRKYCNKNKNRY